MEGLAGRMEVEQMAKGAVEAEHLEEREVATVEAVMAVEMAEEAMAAAQVEARVEVGTAEA